MRIPSHADNIDGTSYAVLDPPADGLFRPLCATARSTEPLGLEANAR